MRDRRKEDKVIKWQDKAEREGEKKQERQSGGMQGHLLSQDPSPGEEKKKICSLTRLPFSCQIAAKKKKLLQNIS